MTTFQPVSTNVFQKVLSLTKIEEESWTFCDENVQ